MGILGHVLSLETGIPFDQLIKYKILNILGMDSTGISMNATSVAVPDDIKSRFAKGRLVGKESDLAFPPQPVQAAGAMYSIVNDLLKYLTANMGLVDTKLKDAMERSHLIRHSFDEVQTTFIEPNGHKIPGHEYIGIGWLVATDLGREVTRHNAGIDGYSAFIGYNLAK
jgi:serine-type D-Ala-D-Ala carboxypeptidase/endopeptidase